MGKISRAQDFIQQSNKAWQRVWAKWLALRQRSVAKILTALYGRPVMVAPQHVVALGGVMVLWSWPTENGRTQSGPKMLLMVRPKAKTGDRRARFVSHLGLGKAPDLTTALRQTLINQLGPVFTRLLGTEAFSPRKIAAMPLLNLTDEDTGGQIPLQLMAWVAELRPNQEAAIQLAENLELVWVDETALDSPQISPTHRQLWRTIEPTLPKLRSKHAREDGVELVSTEDATLATEKTKSVKILH